MLKTNEYFKTKIPCPWCGEGNLVVAREIDNCDFACLNCRNPYSNQNIEEQCPEEYKKFVSEYGYIA